MVVLEAGEVLEAAAGADVVGQVQVGAAGEVEGGGFNLVGGLEGVGANGGAQGGQDTLGDEAAGG